MKLHLLVLEVVLLASIICVHPHPRKLIFKSGEGTTWYFHSAADSTSNHSSRQLVTKRQTGDDMASDEDEQYCHLMLEELRCSSGYYQALIDASLHCGHRYVDLGRQTAVYCAQNERGEYCTTVYYNLINTAYDLSTIDSYCSGVARSNSCPVNCRNQLQILKEKLGCCPVSYLSEYTYQEFTRSAYDYSVWNQCGVPLPTQCEIQSFSAVDESQSCTSDEFNEYFVAQGLCIRGGVGQTYIKRLLSTDHERCSQVNDNYNYSLIATSFVKICSLNEHGEQCYTFYIQGLLLQNLNNIRIQCSNASHSPQGSCSQACASSIIQAKNSIGCCIDDSALFYDYDDYRAILSYDLWNSCGVEPPGVCESTLSLNGMRSKSIMRGISFWITTFATLLVLYTCSLSN